MPAKSNKVVVTAKKFKCLYRNKFQPFLRLWEPVISRGRAKAFLMLPNLITKAMYNRKMKSSKRLWIWKTFCAKTAGSPTSWIAPIQLVRCTTLGQKAMLYKTKTWILQENRALQYKRTQVWRKTNRWGSLLASSSMHLRTP